jgi:hypothetical protein
MEKGYVQFHRGLAWVKNKHKISLAPKEGELFIYNMNSMKYICLNAYVCKACEKILVDYSDSGSDYEYQKG